MSLLNTSDDLHSWFNTGTACVEFIVTALALRHSHRTRRRLGKVEREANEDIDAKIEECVQQVLIANPDLIRNLASDMLLEQRLRERLRERDDE